MFGVYEVLYDILEESVALTEDLAGEAMEIFKRNGNPRFDREPMIRQQVFNSEEEAKMADMSTPEGIEYMSYVARRLAIFGGE